MTTSLARSGSGETYAGLASSWRQDCLRRQKSAHLIGVNDGSASQWRTPTDDSTRGGPQSGVKRLEGGHTMNLQDQVMDFPMWQTPSVDSFRSRGGDRKSEMGLDQQARFWPTPDAQVINDGEEPETFLARKEKEKEKGINGNGMGTPLAMAAKMFQASARPTPTSRDWKDTGNLENVPENSLLGRVAANWSTPRASDGEKGGPNQSFGAGGIPLSAQAQQWRTPTSSEEKRGDSPDWTPDAQAGEHSLPRQATQWQTSRAHEVGDYQYSRGDKTKPVLTLTGQASLASSLPDQPISTVGEESSHIRRSLSPRFVEWLMAWPLGWTSLALTPPASSGSDFLEMELSVFKQRMRSALSQLASPSAAPSVQLGLFA